MNNKICFWRRISFFAIASFLAPSALAELEELVVTTTRRVESLQDVPVSVATVTGQAILEGGFSDMEDLSTFIPNLQMQDTIVGQFLSIRGIGSSTYNEAFEQAVAQFHDGVYYGRDNLGQNAFYDLERVEIVRGPQPTFAGHSATAGALNYISRKPGESFEGHVTGSYGNDEELSFEFGVGGPVSDNFGLRLAGRVYELDETGYTDVTTGAPLGIKDNLALRLTGVWHPGANLDLTFKYERNEVSQLGTPREYTRCDTRPGFSSAHPVIAPGFAAVCALDALYNGATLDVEDGLLGTGGSQDVWVVSEALDEQFGLTPGVPGSYTPAASPVPRGLDKVAEYGFPEEREHQSDVFLLDLNWDVGEYRLSLTASKLQYDKHDWLDPDGGTVALFTDERSETFDQSAVELRLTSPTNQKFSWMLGAYYQTSDLDTAIDVYLPRTLGPAPPGALAVSFGGELREEATWASLFLAATYSITDRLRLNIGGRLQDIQKHGVLTATNVFLFPEQTTFYPNGRVRNDVATLLADADANDLLPELGLEFDTNERSMLYARYAEAIKAGGFVMSPAIGGSLPDPFTYKPERADGVELGYKTSMFNGSLEFNLAYYDVDYKDLQVSIFVSQSGTFITDNAAEAHTRGLEIDGRWAVTENLTLGFSGAVNEAEYDKYDGANCNTLDTKIRGNPCFNDLAGVSLPLSPDYTVALHPEFNFNLGDYRGRFGANLMFSDGYDLGNDFDPIDRVPDFHRLDLRFSIFSARDNWEIALYGRNITDERPALQGAGDFMNKSSDLIFDAGGFQRDRGSRWGIQASYSFGS